ncbi:type IV secretory system conjugative DNA transfer family protein, partial [Staphylococcus pseudintermedius]|nr:type IV secretory system conjugative DNA transfer family protein [Staphylococcus pseudintermedius]
MTGTIIGMHNNKAIVQHNDSKPNRNILVVGGPGSYKTQSVVITNILNETENSIVVTDTKGEITESTLKIKQMQGYDTYVVNYDNMQASNRVN